MGMVVYNSFYKSSGMNFSYVSVLPDNVESIVSALRTLNLYGASISMPFKELIVPLLDELDETAVLAKSVNTVKNMNGKLVGYSTDYIAVKALMEKINPKSIRVIGTGAIAKLGVIVAREVSVERIVAVSRSCDKTQEFADSYGIRRENYNQTSYDHVDLLFNATPETNMSERLIERCNTYFEAQVADKSSYSLTAAKKIGKNIVAGSEMYITQVSRQFQIYHDIKISEDKILKSLEI